MDGMFVTLVTGYFSMTFIVVFHYFGLSDNSIQEYFFNYLKRVKFRGSKISRFRERVTVVFFDFARV